MNDRGHHLPHDFNTLGYLAAVEAAVPGNSTSLIKLFAKNSPEGFGIYRFTSTGEVTNWREAGQLLLEKKSGYFQ